MLSDLQFEGSPNRCFVVVAPQYGSSFHKVFICWKESSSNHMSSPTVWPFWGQQFVFAKLSHATRFCNLKKRWTRVSSGGAIFGCFFSLAVSNNGNRKSVVFHDSIPKSIDAIIARHFSSAFWLMGKCGFFFGLPFFFPWLDSSNKMSET